MTQITDLSPKFQDLINNILLDKEIKSEILLELYEFVENQFFENNPDFVTSNWNWDTNTVNGNEIEGRLIGLENPETIIDQEIDGKKLIATKGTRKAGTRVGVHVHESGGATFVIGGQGAITDIVEEYPISFNP